SELAADDKASHATDREKIIDLISKDRLRTAMELMLKQDDDGDLYQDLIHLMGRLSRTKDQYHRRTISEESYSLEMSKLSEDVLYLVDKL
ncbi:MAG: hypothetical protein AAFU67_11615, partial [Bacteroidota bacterium]